MMKLIRGVGISALVALGGVGMASGGPRPDVPMAPGATIEPGLTERPDWGTTNPSILRIPSAAFFPVDQNGTVQWAYYGIGRWQSGGNSDFGAPLLLPAGARILGVELDGVDTNASANLSTYFLVGDATDGSGLNYGGGSTTGSSGQQTVYHDLSGSALTVDNVNKIYEVDVSFNGVNTNTLRLASVAVFYRLQVSTPSGQTFGDVPPANPFYQYIEALAASGITGGCGGGNFCPNNPVTRGQMAVFLAKALGLYFE